MIGQKLNNRYLVSTRLGKGAMGTVYRATDTQTGQDVALKVIAGDLAVDPAMLERFNREGQALRQLKHPNIVGFIDAFQHEEHYVIVMEYITGGSLHDLIKEGPLPIERARRIALELCDALIRSHHLNIIHRDLKPENVLIAEDGTPKLADFGVARLSEGTRMTRSGTQVGTPYYMAPEAWEGKELDAQADIWSLGVLLFEMLTGQVPFSGETGPTVMNKVFTTQPPDLRKLRAEVPPNFAQVIKRMLTRDKKKRYPTMREVAVELERGQRATTSLPRQMKPQMTIAEKAVKRIKAIKLSSRQGRNFGILTFVLVAITGLIRFGQQSSFSVSSLLSDSIALLSLGSTSIPIGTAIPTATLTRTPIPTRKPTQTATITPTPSYVEGNILFAEDFEEGNMPSFTFNTFPNTNNPKQYWFIQEAIKGNHILTGIPPDSTEIGFNFGQGSWRDYSINLDIQFVDPSSSRRNFELGFRTSPSRCTGYIFLFGSNGFGLGFPEQLTNKCEFSLLDSGYHITEINQWYAIRLDVFESTISIFIDGTLVENYLHTGSLNGGVSFGTGPNPGEFNFDNIRILELTSR